MPQGRNFKETMISTYVDIILTAQPTLSHKSITLPIDPDAVKNQMSVGEYHEDVSWKMFLKDSVFHKETIVVTNVRVSNTCLNWWLEQQVLQVAGSMKFRQTLHLIELYPYSGDYFHHE